MIMNSLKLMELFGINKASLVRVYSPERVCNGKIFPANDQYYSPVLS